MRRLLLGLPLLASFASATVHYKLTPLPSSKSLLVAITLDSANASETFKIPGWSPGYYQMAEYQKKVYDTKATDSAGNLLTVRKLDSRSWNVESANGGKVTFSYKVQGDDPGLGFFAVKVQDDKAFLNGPAAFMYSADRKTEGIDLKIQTPAGWEVATAMDPVGDHSYSASGYDEFADHPIQLGKFQTKGFMIDGIPFSVVFVAPNNTAACDMDAETERLRKVSVPALHMFRGASFRRYLYILHLEVGNFSGGLEHRACNVQAVANSAQLHLDDLAAHEYFHAWNVKQIRPANLGPFDYTQPQRTGNLWFAEGVTDYYSKLHTYQSGIQSEAWLKGQLLAQIQELQNGQTRKVKTVEDCSRECWEGDGFSVGDLSYYTKGLLAGFILDAAILDATNGSKTLDDLMRLLYLQHKLPNPGYGEDELRNAINDVAGVDLSDVYNRMIRSTQELPYALLSKIGLKVSVPDSTANPLRLAGSRSGAPLGYSLEVDPNATPRAKKLYQAWLHRLD